MSDMDEAPDPTLTGLSDSDLELIRAMQPDVRASWAQVARRIGTSAPTVRRRWEALASTGRAWITSYIAPSMPIVLGVVDIGCRPGATDAVAETLVQVPAAVTVRGVTGARDLTCLVMAHDMTGFRATVQREIAIIPGVERIRSSLITRSFRDGSAWRAGDAPVDQPPRSPGARPTLTPRLLRTLAILEHDGRASAASAARTLEVGEPQAGRLLRDAVTSGAVSQRIDIAFGNVHWPHALVLWLLAPPARLEESARRIAARAETRMSVTLAGGPANLYAVVWLASLAEATDVEASLTAGTDTRVVDRAVILNYYKRLGHVLDERGRRRAFVGWADGQLGATRR